MITYITLLKSKENVSPAKLYKSENQSRVRADASRLRFPCNLRYLYIRLKETTGVESVGVIAQMRSAESSHQHLKLRQNLVP